MSRPSTLDLYHRTVRLKAETDMVFMEMVNHETNPLTRDELLKLIARRPALWGRFSAWLDQLPADFDEDNSDESEDRVEPHITF